MKPEPDPAVAVLGGGGGGGVGGELEDGVAVVVVEGEAAGVEVFLDRGEGEVGAVERSEDFDRAFRKVVEKPKPRNRA